MHPQTEYLAEGGVLLRRKFAGRNVPVELPKRRLDQSRTAYLFQRQPVEIQAPASAAQQESWKHVHLGFVCNRSQTLHAPPVTSKPRKKLYASQLWEPRSNPLWMNMFANILSQNIQL